ncbi:hypothetical protein KM043_015293 [Ampulex compressa]|nr:hypothetical protein KM043_015293 [Ampulex compressa]
MKKSPLSTPSGSRGGHSRNWKSQENTNRTGSGGYNHYRNNYHATPKSNCNNSYSPYKHSGKQFHGQRKGYQRGMQRQVDISRYVDMKSFLEDPWAELTKKLNKSLEVDKNESSMFDYSSNSKLVDDNSEQDSESKSTMDVTSLQCSPQSKHDSSIDVTLGLDDTGLSQVSKAESSIDLKLDDMKFSQESKNESLSSIDDGICEEPCIEDNVHAPSESERNIAQKLT